MKKNFKHQVHKIRFLLTLTRQIGGVWITFWKVVKFLFTRPPSQILAKVKYILNHAGISVTGEIDNNEYQKWLETYREIFDPGPAKIKRKISFMEDRPLISILLPVYNPRANWFCEAVQSVLDQTYTNWELCIADDASTNLHVIAELKRIQDSDERIKVIFRKENGHISEASNSALALASGEWVTLLDHDDLFHRDALFWAAMAMNENKDAHLIYSDEDKIDSSGKRMDPYFKCDWNYSLFLSHNMICHLGVYRANIIKAIGGFRVGFEGSQDYDLALRFIEKISADQIYHIPRVLYHWRIHSKSTSMGSEKKPYALLSAQRAISEHLRRKGLNASVEIIPVHMYRVKYKLPEKSPFVSIIIPTRNHKNLLERCIKSIIDKTDYPNFEILVVDNNSDVPETTSYMDDLGKTGKIRLLKDPRPFNFSAINNRAVKKANGKYLCFLNDDTEVITPEWLSEMVSHAIQAGVGVVGAKLWYPTDKLQHAGVILGIGGVAGHSHKFMNKNDVSYFNRTNVIQEFSAVTAACMVVNKKIFIDADGFDENNLTIAFNDVDLCLKIKALGYRIIWTPYAELYHHESISRGDDFHPDKIKRFMKENEFILQKWCKQISDDPAYSPNLSLLREDFSLAWPPRVNDSIENV